MPKHLPEHLLNGKSPSNGETASKGLKVIRAALPKYEVHEWRHAGAVLTTDFKKEWEDIRDVLTRFKLLKSQVIVGGGSKTEMANWIDHELCKVKGWSERNFKTAIQIDEQSLKSPTHKVDCFKNKVGLEIEWNNKDPFFDRDLNNFRLLFELRALAVGIILTRSEDLTPLFRELTERGLKSKTAYGESTTHMSKLLPRLEGGAGGGCPVLVLGITTKLFTEDVTDEEGRELLRKLEEAKKKKRQKKSLSFEEIGLLESAGE
ncbi:MAG TPA: BglII/BstYI family type II restriction endonuclease [Candidatus Udaeobacter sp.]|nr:BglII/BstYI family type II restriction endonuclease [Candidatus Udaeobacter sp.]